MKRRYRNSLPPLLSGLGAGAALMYLLDPRSGKRRRARIREETLHGAKSAGSLGAKAQEDLKNRGRGLLAKMGRLVKKKEVSDETLTERARSVLGRASSHPAAIAVRAKDGKVTVAGLVLTHEADKVLSRIARIPGVNLVEDHLDRHDSADGIPALQGGGKREARPELLQENWAPGTRTLVGTAGLGLLGYGLKRGRALGYVLDSVGGALMLRSLTNLPWKRLTGIGAKRNAVSFQKTISVAVPVEEAYAFFSDFENFPKFMTNVKEVKVSGDGKSHWVVDGPARASVSWEAETTQAVPNEVLAWKSVKGSLVRHAGRIRFQPEEGGTRIEIRMSYNPPAGAIGHGIATLFRVDPKTQLDEDMTRVKTFLETGRPAHDAQAPQA